MTTAEFSCDLLGMELEDRLRAVKDAKRWSWREWCRQAKLSEETHLGTHMRKVKQWEALPRPARKQKKRPTLTLPVAAALADAAGVNLEWLARGEGEMWRMHAIDRTDPYPSRAIAIAFATVWLVDDSTIQRIRSVDKFRDDPGLDYWIGELRAAESDATRRAQRDD